MKIQPLFITLLIYFVLSVQTHAAIERPVLLDYFARDIVFPDKKIHQLHRRVIREVESMQIEAASMAAAKINEDGNGFNTDLVAAMKSNRSILHGSLGDWERGVYYIDKAIEITEKEHGIFHPFLFEKLLVKGLILEKSGSVKETEDAIRRAQHISHRQEGVFATRQLVIIDYLTLVNLKRGKLLDANREQRFYLTINEKTYGTDSEEMLSALSKVGNYFGDRGYRTSVTLDKNSETNLDRAKLFRESTGLFQRAINIVENKYGAGDLRLVEPLKDMAKIRLLQGHSENTAEKLMERVADIVTDHPASDVPDLARALTELGDIYTRTSNAKAPETYAQAWELLSQDARYHALRDELFGSVTRIFPEILSPLPLDRLPSGAGPDDKLYTRLQYNVAKSGRVYNVEVVDSNVPNEAKKQARKKLSDSRYRPKIVDGKAVDTKALTLQQTFVIN